MDSHEAFMRPIHENPDDDSPRLVYADWLEENGYPLFAEFIRVQIELHRTGQHHKTYLLRTHSAQRELLERSEGEFLRVLIHAAEHLRQEGRDGFAFHGGRRTAGDQQAVAHGEQRTTHARQA